LLTADWQTPVQNLGVSLQLFDIGAGYVSAVGARRESDVLLTEGTEAAWYGWGDPKYIGGQAADFQQVPVTIRDNDFMDFDENPAESAIGWKGVTMLLKYELAASPISLEYTHLDYNQNWQNWGGQQNVFDVISWGGPTGPNFKQNTDRKTDIFVFKVNHVFQVFGGLDTSFKWKNGIVVSVGNQLFNDLYGSLSFGRYSRDITLGPNQYNNDKDIISLRFAYNLTGFELGMLAQWINGTGDPQQTGTQIGVEQYRMKAFTKVIF
jgi:hypothetical protein